MVPTLTSVRSRWGMSLSLALVLALTLCGQAFAAATSMDVSYHQVVVWTGLPDGVTHSLVVFTNGFENPHSRPPIVKVGTYGVEDDVELQLAPVDGGWEATASDANGAVLGTVTVLYESDADARLVVSDGLLETENEYLHPASEDPPACSGYAWWFGYC